MTPKKIYGPWIKWNGGECPVPPDTLVEVKLRYGVWELSGLAKKYCWQHDGKDGDIVSYSIITEQHDGKDGDIVSHSIITEQHDLEAAEKLLRENGYTVTPPTKPLTFEDVTPMTELPAEGTAYWVVHPFRKEGVALVSWTNDDFDKLFLRRRMAYLEKEQALIAARHIFGLKGGEP